MKGKTPIILAVLMFVLGVMAICANQVFASKEVVILGGVLFIVAGFISMLMPYFTNKAKAKALADVDTEQTATAKQPTSKVKSVINLLVSNAAMILGVVMICMVDTFIPFIPVTFGLFILLGSIVLFYSLAIGVRPAMLPGWLYAFPIVLLIDAVLVYFRETPVDDSLVMILTGLGACVYGVGTLLMLTYLSKMQKYLVQQQDNEKVDLD